MHNESELRKNMVIHGQEFVERRGRCAGLGYTPCKPNCTCHMWVDKMVCMQPAGEWREDVLGYS